MKNLRKTQTAVIDQSKIKRQDQQSVGVTMTKIMRVVLTMTTMMRMTITTRRFRIEIIDERKRAGEDAIAIVKKKAEKMRKVVDPETENEQSGETQTLTAFTAMMSII